MAERTYHEHEIAALLERASERQALAARRTQRPGLTLAELEQIAAEAGIDPAHLHAAAAELDDPGRPLVGRRSGTTATHIYTERWVPGELTSEAWEDVVAELRHRFDSALVGSLGMGDYGLSTTEQVGRTVEWKHTSLSGIETRVLVQPREGQLRIRLNQRVGVASTAVEAGLYGGVLTFLGGAVAAGAVDSLALGMALVGLLFVLSYLGVFAADRAWRRKKHHELEELADVVAGMVAQPEPVAAAPEATAAQTAPTIALPEEPVESEAPVRAGRRTRS